MDVISYSRIATIADYVALFKISERTASRYRSQDRKRKGTNRVTLRMVMDIWELDVTDLACLFPQLQAK